MARHHHIGSAEHRKRGSGTNAVAGRLSSATVDQAAAASARGGAGDGRAADAEEARPRPPAAPWQNLVRRGSLLVAIAALVTALILGYRYGTTHRWRLDAATSDGRLLPILLALLAFALAGAVVAFRPERGDVRRLGGTVAVWSVALLATLAGVWYLVDADVRDDVAIGTPLRGQSDLDAFLAEQPGAPAGGAGPYHVPTGVFIESIEFLNPNDVQVSGFVWQRYGPAVPGDVTRGFVLPEAVTGTYPGDPAYQFTEADGTEVVGWHITATMRQRFDYRRYPFDRQDVWLRLWHEDFDRGVVLVPDFGAYPDLAPSALPGVDSQFVYGGWTPDYAGYSFVSNRYDADFGFRAVPEQGAIPELYFNVGLKREFLGPFFDHIVLTLVVALLLFAILALTTKEAESKSRIGISTFGVLGSCSGLLFAVVLKHGQIRSVVGSQQTVYLETLPFILYLAILIVSLNAILLDSPVRLRPLEYRNNLLPDLLYWPLLLGLLLAVTLATLHG